MIRVLLCDDHRIVRDGLRWMLVNEPSIAVVGEAASGEALLSLIEEIEADVILLDLRMPGMSGIDILAALEEVQNSPRVLMLSMYDEPELIQQAVALGAAGYVKKSAGRDDLIQAIEMVASGRLSLQGDLAPGLVARLTEAPRDPPQLSEQDRAILRCMAEGMRNREIAAKLDIAPRTLLSQVQALFARLGVHSRSEAVATALRLGAIE